MTSDEEENAVKELCELIGSRRVAEIAQRFTARGFFANLTSEQQKAALEYRGEENHGDVTFRSDAVYKGTRQRPDHPMSKRTPGA